MATIPSASRRMHAKVDRTKLYPVQEALKLVKDDATAKFDESVDVAINLGIDAKKSDQTVRGSVVLPQGTGKTVRVAVFAQGDKAQQAADAGADIVGFEDLAERDQGRQDGFRRRDRHARTRCASSGQLGQILGPRGLMPNPKVGTVTPGCRDGGEERQGRPGAVPHRQGRHRPVHDRPRLVHGRGARGEPAGAGGRGEQGEARRREGHLSEEDHGLQHDGRRACASIRRACCAVEWTQLERTDE